MYQTLINALRETLFMVSCASIITILIGVPLGVLTAFLATSHSKIIKGIYYALTGVMQFARITPYLLLMILFIPLSNWFIDHKISYTNATIVPLATAGILLLANKVYTQLHNLSQQWHTTTKIMGASESQTFWLILLPESYHDIIYKSATVCSLIVGFSAVAGALGAGGLGQLAIESSINDPDPLLVILCIILLITLQQIIYYAGSLIVTQKQARS